MFPLALRNQVMVLTRASSRLLSSVSKDNLTVENVPAENMFKMKLNDLYATVSYEKRGNVLNLIHSEVPVVYQGKGYGAVLTKKTFDYVAENNLQMIITCDYLLAVYKKNEDKYKECYKG